MYVRREGSEYFHARKLLERQKKVKAKHPDRLKSSRPTPELNIGVTERTKPLWVRTTKLLNRTFNGREFKEGTAESGKNEV